jgi:hypothetical protein
MRFVPVFTVDHDFTEKYRQFNGNLKKKVSRKDAKTQNEASFRVPLGDGDFSRS